MKDNQKKMIMQYMEKHGSITHREAEDYLGCTRLSARIGELRKQGFSIVTHMEPGVNRFGNRTSHARYWLKTAETLEGGTVNA